MTLYTDGLPEARNAAGELLGFARVAELVAAHSGARALAEAAVQFGQEDDVTVLRICHAGRGVGHIADGLAAAGATDISAERT
jgi:hypothetical protein